MNVNAVLFCEVNVYQIFWYSWFLISFVGNVGPYLNSSANVFLSTDAGISWKKVSHLLKNKIFRYFYFYCMF